MAAFPIPRTVRLKLLISALVTFAFVLIAAGAAWLGLGAIDRAGTATLRHATLGMHLQMLIKDVNQLVTTSGAAAVRGRMQGTLQNLVPPSGTDGGADSKLVSNWQEIKTDLEALLAEKNISEENDEILLRVIQTIARLDGMAGEVNQLAEQARADAAATARQIRWTLGGLFAGLLAYVVGNFVWLYFSLLSQLGGEPGDAAQVVKQVAEGDLTVDVAVVERRKGSTVLAAMREMLERLGNVVRRIDEANRRISQSAFQIATLSKGIAESTEEQRAGAEQVNSATDVLSRNSRAVLDLAEQVRQRTVDTEQQAGAGIGAVEANIKEMANTVERVDAAAAEMKILGESAEKIHVIIESISAIASQTNLLSLNAAIEAARAGEQGRGFAVVADEVRKLAGRTSDATGEITRIVNGLNAQLGRARETMGEVVVSVGETREASEGTATAIRQMVERVREMESANHRITEASQEQMTNLENLQVRLAKLFETLERSAQRLGVNHTISDDLYQTVEAVNRLMAYFTFDRARIRQPEPDDKRRYPRVSQTMLVSVDSESGGDPHEMVARDFSLGGMCLRCSNPWSSQTGERYVLSVRRPRASLEDYAGQQPARLGARLVWQRREGEQYLYGFQFEARDEASVRQLQECFSFFNEASVYQD